MNTPLSTATDQDMILYYLYCMNLIILAIALTVIVIKPLLRLISSLDEWISEDKIADLLLTVILIGFTTILENQLAKAFFNLLIDKI